MLLIGGGTGIAPLLSIVRHLVEQGVEREMHLYWGVRSQQDLYAQATLERLSRRAASLTYVPVLSEAKSGWHGATGWVHETALKGIRDLEAAEVYAAGPPAMIAAIRREYESRGCATTRLYFDSFDYAPGYARAPADQRGRQVMILRRFRLQQRSLETHSRNPDATRSPGTSQYARSNSLRNFRGARCSSAAPISRLVAVTT